MPTDWRTRLAGGFPRRLADPYPYESFAHMQEMNQFMTICAIGMGAAQLIFAANFVWSLFFGPECGRNPWRANSLEWMVERVAGIVAIEVSYLQPISGW